MTDAPLVLAHLVISKDHSPPIDFPISTDTVTIGRAKDNLLCLDDPLISRYHARLSQDSRGWSLTDLGSAEKTLVNGIEVLPRTPVPLDEGDLIEIGSFELRFSQEHHEGVSATGTAVTIMAQQAAEGTVVAAIPLVPILRVVTPNWTKDFPLEKDIVRLGRDPQSDIVIDAPVVSSNHAQIKRTPAGYEILDLDSLNGLAFNGRLVKERLLQLGDVIYIGTSVTLLYQTKQFQEDSEPVKLLNLRDRDRWTLGRDSQNDMVIDHPMVSRCHARIERKKNALVLTDLGSTNGTFVNGQPITAEYFLQPGDTINIGPSRFVFNLDETIVHHVEGNNLRLDAIHLKKVVGEGTILLNDISLSILPREFVVIVGGSGSGKSTLLDALNGFRPATSGTVLLNQVDLYKNFNAYRTALGYVPQDDIIHMELTVTEALDYAAQLRMPPDTTAQERRKRIEEVIEDLDLGARRDVQVRRLSGGQRKRVSIGVELITKPGLFFLDEATSGLDPSTEEQIMRLLRKLADQGRTVILITHVPDNLMLCDELIFLAFGGRLAYFGPPDQITEHFKVKELKAIYPKLENEKSPDEWQQIYLQSSQYQKYVVERQKHLQLNAAAPGQRPKQQLPPTKIKQASDWQQFWIMCRRNLTILSRDRASLILMFAVAPILGCFNFFLGSRDTFDAADGDLSRSILLLFIMSMTPVIVGSLATMRELVKESEIYKRERMIGLKLLPYLFSKVGVAALFALYQAAAFLLLAWISVNPPGGLDAYVGMYITLFLAVLAGMVMGLLVSGISPTQNVAPLLTVVFLLPQIFFSGGMIAPNNLPLPGQVLNQVSIIKYPFESLVTLTGIGRDIAEDVCWQKSGTERSKLTEAEQQKCQCLGTNIFQQCAVPGISSEYKKPDKKAALERKEPAKPQDPGPFPDDLSLLQSYKDKMNKYQDDMKKYQTDYADWRSDRDEVIKGAETQIDRFQQDFGGMLKVNLLQHWLRLSAIMVVMFGALVVLQKRKDVV
uniref:FHA modulated ABC efflux pump with fused ATPase and integral membrane subunits n=1 Tax=Cyanothece sp. (strain PCC 7425 / ATCC 29141) TaxID=395961 RepID=B8HPQ7_CYAP4